MEWYWLSHSGHSLGSLLKTGPFEEFHDRLRSPAEHWMTPVSLHAASLECAETAHSSDADHRFRQADRRFQTMPITLEERRSMRGAEGWV